MPSTLEIRHHPSANSVQPKEFLLSARKLAEPTPYDDKGLGNEILDSRRVVESTQAVAHEGVTMRDHEPCEFLVSVWHGRLSLFHHYLNVRLEPIPFMIFSRP